LCCWHWAWWRCCCAGVRRLGEALARRRAAVLALGFALLPLTSLAMWEAWTDAELLRRSDLVVIGEWQGVAALNLPAPTGALALGAISVAEVLKGARGQTVVLVVQPGAGSLRSSSDLVYRRGDRGLWLLRARPGGDGLYLVDHPQRFVAAADVARIAALRALIAQR